MKDTVSVVDCDTNVASTHAELLTVTRRRDSTLGAHDLIIAATAKATEQVILSADSSAFQDLPGIEVRSPRRAQVAGRLGATAVCRARQ